MHTIQIIIILVNLYFHSWSVLSDTIIINTKKGQIRGLETIEGRAFLGVPYAQPPIGNLRWQSPFEHAPWYPSVYNATSVKPGCPQKGCKDGNPATVCPDQTSEDCLYLYIWTPPNTNSSSNLPVIVYIHGGNFVHMSAGGLLFNGAHLANKGNVVVINMEYRLGALGFLLTLDTSKGKGAHGNYAIEDQRLALKWISENIQSFGGNPHQVTLSGQSAGAQSTVVHLMTNDSAQYFHRAIIESAPLGIPFKERSEMLFISRMLSRQLNCTEDDLECLKTKTADEIAEAQHAIRPYPSSVKLLDFFEPWLPYVDRMFVPFQPLQALEKGCFVEMPIIIGTLTEETRIYVYNAWNKPLSPVKYSAALLLTFPSNIIEILSIYPPPVTSDARDALVVPATDFTFTCPTRNYSRLASIYNNDNVWMYTFDHAFSFKGWGQFTFCQGHVCHGSDIPFEMRSWTDGNFTATPEEWKLSEQMMLFWSNFAKSGDPNKGAKSDIPWPKYTPHQNWPYMLFETPGNIIGVNYRREYCDFWDTIGYKA